jgi:glyceraldehyde-3-phosphate dehydrogenase (NAD(P))
MKALLFGKSYKDAFSHTESIFNMKERKQKLESHFARKN